MIRNGLTYKFGIGFWSANGHDAIWHLSLINSLKKFSIQNPIFAGHKLTNYHLGFDILMAIVSQISRVDALTIYFQIFPVVTSFLLAFYSYKITYKYSKNHKTCIISIVLLFFSSSFGYIYTLFKSGSIGGESLFWSMQPYSFLINPPLMLSILIILIYLNNPKKIILNGFLLSLLFQIKIYAAILVSLSFTILWLFDFIRTKKIINQYLSIGISMLIFSLPWIYLLFINQSAGLLIFKPLWFTHSLIESYDKLYIPKLASFRFNVWQNLSVLKFPFVVFLEIILICIFFAGNLGPRLISFVNIKKVYKHSPFIVVFMILSGILPLVFIQKGTSWNTIQFFYYLVFFLNIYFADYIVSDLKKPLFTGLLIATSCLGSYDNLKNYLGNPPPAALITNQKKALEYLKNQPYGLILTYPFENSDTRVSTPIPLNYYTSTAYVSAFSSKPVFMEDEINLDIIGVDWKTRKNMIYSQFFKTLDSHQARGFLLNNRIDYIYLEPDQTLPFSLLDLQLWQIYSADGIKIFKVQK